MKDITLDDLRDSIYNIDVAICYNLAERFHTALKVGEFKRQHQLPALDKNRWETLLNIKVEMALKLGIDAALVRNIFNDIHEESLRLQDQRHKLSH